MDVVTNKSENNIVAKLVGKESGRLGFGLVLYNVWMLLCCMVVMIGQVVFALIASGDFSDTGFEKALNQYMESGTGAVVAVLTGVLFLGVFLRRVEREPLFEQKKAMHLGVFLQFLCIFMMMQGIFSIAGTGIESGLNLFGLTVMEQIEQASSTSTTISMLLYASFLGPITEELVFRGFVLKTLHKYGSLQAIFICALLFGLFHGNLVQGIFAFGVGLVLGYVAEYYSIYWAMALHIINNFVFSDLMGWCLRDSSELVENIVLYGIQIVFFLAGLLILYRRKGKLYALMQQWRWNHVKEIFLNPGMILFIVLMLLLSLDGISRL